MTSSSRRLSDKLTAIAVLFMLVALAAVGITLYVAWQLEGGAAAVNAMGSQRMRSYHIGMLLAERAARPAAEAELSAAVRAETAAFESTLTELAAGDPARPLVMPRTAPIQDRFSGLQARWSGQMRPAIESLLTAPDPQARVADLAGLPSGDRKLSCRRSMHWCWRWSTRSRARPRCCACCSTG